MYGFHTSSPLFLTSACMVLVHRLGKTMYGFHTFDKQDVFIINKRVG